MTSLARVLEAINRLIEQKDEEIDDTTSEAQRFPPRALHLLEVTSSSAAYAVSAADRETPTRVFSCLGESLKKPKSAEWTEPTLSSLKELSDVAKSLGCKIELRKPGKGSRAVLARIIPTTYSEIVGTAYINGKTSVFARIERVGGATNMHCGIRLPESPQKMVICRVVSETLVRQLGQYMYQDVILSGRASWLRHNWRLKTLIIESFEPPKTGSVRETLIDLREAGGDAWDNINDPDAYLAEMRGA